MQRVGQSKVRVNNWADNGYTVSATEKIDSRPLREADILDRAFEFLSKQGHAPEFYLFESCEHFATYCRYDRAFSGQIIAYNRTVSGVVRGITNFFRLT